MASTRAWLVATVIGWAAAGVRAHAEESVTLPDGTHVECIDFERHVAGLFTRLGCNAGSCHGSHEGQGGFKLSLFGQSPQQDFAALTAADTGRIDVSDPDASLILRKPTLGLHHEGGLRLQRDSWEFGLLRRWIVEGARHRPGSGHITRLSSTPAELASFSLGQSLPVTVRAEFADGTCEVVTALAGFRTRDEQVAEVTSQGVVTARGPGATHVIITYRDRFLAVDVTVSYPAVTRVEQSLTNSEVVALNFIDEEINGQLAKLNLSASPPADDAEFLRRATLDVLGSLPKPDEVRSYMADTDPAKRDRLVARLLADPRRAGWWATRMCDITACNVNAMEEPAAVRPKRAKMWHDWFRVRFANNLPYDELVRGVLCATSRNNQPVEAWINSAMALEKQAAEGFTSNYDAQPNLDLFWRRTNGEGPVPVEDLAELTASAFLGLRLHCARCHQHPFDRWSQRDFAAYATIFARIEFGSGTDLRTAMNSILDERRQARREGRPVSDAPIPRLQEVFVSSRARPLVDAAVAGPVVPQPPGGEAFVGGDKSPRGSATDDPRQQLYAWLTRPDNPYFARNFVNRVWAKYFGRGLIEPVDALSESNPPSNRRLLERLAAEFVASGYDVIRLERLVLSSAAYGRSWRSSGNNASDHNQFARWPVRSLPAEVLIDAVDTALVTRTNFGPDVPSGTRAIELAPNRLTEKNVDELLQLLGRGDRKSLCECDRATGPLLRQPIFLITRPDVPAVDGRLSRLLGAGYEPKVIITEFYLATVSRLPDDGELAFALEHVTEAPDPSVGLADVVWALINTREFSTNH